MADLAQSIQTAKKAGYSDAEIAAFIANDPSMGGKVKTARQAGYNDAEIISFLGGGQEAAQPSRQPPAEPAGSAARRGGETAVRAAPGGIEGAWRQFSGATQERAHAALESIRGGFRDPLNITDVPTPLTAMVTPRSAKLGLDIATLALSPIGGAGETAMRRIDPMADKPGYNNSRVRTAGDLAETVTPVPVGGAASLARAGGRVAGRAAQGIEALARPVVEPVVARVSRRAAEKAAGRRIAEGASDLPAVRASLEAGPVEHVPGSQPTTFQATGDMGLGAMEKNAATSSNEASAAFGQRAAEQNAARRDALTSVQSEGDPGEISRILRERLDALDAEHATAVEAATATAQERAAAMGGTAGPEDIGAQIRAATTEAEQSARASESALWNQLDPDGTLTGNVTATRQAARDIPAAEAPTARPIEGEEAAILEVAANLPDVAPIRDLTALRSRVSTAMREEMRKNGKTPVYARLSRLRGAIEENLAGSISERVASEAQAVARGELAADATVEAKLQGWVDDLAQRTEARAAGGGGSTAGGGSPAGDGPTSPTSLSGAESAPGGPVGRVASDPGVPSDPLQPTVDPGYAERLTTASDATKARARTFGASPVADINRTAGSAGDYRLPAGVVPGRAFTPGPKGKATVEAVLQASPEALPALEEAAALSLRRHPGAVGPDGTVNPRAFAAWRARHQDALSALPAETQARLADAASAGQALSEASAARAAALGRARSGALGRIMGVSDGADVTKSVATILGSNGAVRDIRALANATRSDPTAAAGLRQAIADVLTEKAVRNTEAATSGVDQLSADAFQTFLRRNRAALKEVFTPEEIGVFDAIAADLKRSARSGNAIKAAGSDTAPNLGDKVVSAIKTHASRSVLDIFAAALGGAGGGIPGAALGAAGAHVLQGLHAKGITRIEQLVNQALLDPAFARTLLRKVPTKANGSPDPVALTARMKGVIRALQASAAANEGETK